jgi:hypothetical protein
VIEMAEKQQDLGKGHEQGRRVTLGEAAQNAASSFALAALEETLNKGKMISIPSLGAVITPERDMKDVSELTDEELKANPHVHDPLRSSK